MPDGWLHEDFSFRDLMEPLSSGKKGSSAIMTRMKNELDEQWVSALEALQWKYASETDVILAIGRAVEKTVDISTCSDEIQTLINNFIARKIDHILKFKEHKPECNNASDNL